MPVLPPLAYEPDRQGARGAINTPGLILDLDALDYNIALMADTMKAAGHRLRPHSKSHKCADIARAQIAAGAVGICCATLDEAEIMAAHGIPGILVTSPITSPHKLPRLIALAAAHPDLSIVADACANVRAIGEAAAGRGVVVNVLVDVEVGFGRTGVNDADEAEALAKCIRETRGVTFAGLQAYGGHLQHTADYDERVALCAATHEFVAGIIARLESFGMTPELVTGGGTGTHAIDSQAGPFTEIQAGSYVFLDSEYEAIRYLPDATWPFRNSLFVQTSVISRNTEGQVTTDGGTKAFALNGAPPRLVAEGLEHSVYSYLGDEHGRIALADGDRTPALGEHLECVPSHCDPTVAHYDRYHCVRGDRIVAIWDIHARGRR